MTHSYPSRRRLAGLAGRLMTTAVAAVLALSGAAVLGAVSASAAPSGPQGVDVSHHQGTIDWAQVHGAGKEFAFIKATEGTDFIDDQFQANYANSVANGIIRGAYHFAHPDESASAQLTYFLAHGGDQSPGPHTLPGMVDMEYNPYDNGENDCWNQTPAETVAWVRTFVDGYKTQTGRYPAIYTSAAWWNMCTGGSSAFDGETPLFLVDLTDPVVLPNGFSNWTFRQYSWTGTVAGIPGAGKLDLDVFNGTSAQLAALAGGSGGGSANPYSPTTLCGSGYSVIDSHALTGATIYLLYNSGSNCVVTMATADKGAVAMNATLSVQGGASGSDPGNYHWYAGPVRESAAAACVEWGGAYNGASWTSSWSHCG